MTPSTFPLTSLYNKGLFFLNVVFAITIFISCGEQGKEKWQRDLDDLSTFIHGHRDSVDFYATHDWDAVNMEFEERRANLEKDTAEMDEEMRASYNKSLSDWQEFKTEYNRTRVDNTNIAKMDRLRATLAISGVRPDYTDLNAADIVRQYEHFVNTVRENKDAYTQEQWTVINVNYKALNGRKREIENDIPAKDLRRITKLQLDFTGIKAANRPFADNP